MPLSETVAVGSSVLLPLPTLEGYVFNGWYTQSGSRVGLAGGKYVVNETVVLYAKWTQDQYSESLKYAYEPRVSKYYVDYVIQRSVNGYVYDTYFDSAYFDSYAAAWAFSTTGGPCPTLAFEEVWVDSVNRWWVTDVRDSYEVVVYLENSETYITYYGPDYPGTNLAPVVIVVTIGEYSSYISGVAGESISIETIYDPDIGYFGTDEAVVVFETWWTTSYSGWVYALPDIYMTQIIPANGIVYCCY